MLTTALALALTMPQPLSAAARKLVAPTKVQIYEVVINPPSSGDDASSGESIVLHGPSDTVLDGYAIIVVENESGSHGNGLSTNVGESADDRGTIKNIIPLDGMVLSTNGGVCVIRDDEGVAGSPNSAVNGSYPFVTPGGSTLHPTYVTSKNFDFNNNHSATGTFPAWGGNTLENEGGNYFLVKGLSTSLKQKRENSSGTLTQRGTYLDIDMNGQFDFLQSPTPSSVADIHSGNPNISATTVVADWFIDALFVPLKSSDSSSATQLNYTNDFNVTATPASSADIYSAVSGSVAQSGDTADWVGRVSDSVAIMCDITGNTAWKIDHTKCYKSDVLGTLNMGTTDFAILPGTIPTYITVTATGSPFAGTLVH